MRTIMFMPELSPEDRVKELKKVCAVSDYEKFNRNLTESEIELERHAYAETGMRLEDLDYEAKESAESFRLKIKALKTDAEEKLKRIRTGQREVYDATYGVPDYETGKMVFFDKYGEIVRTRNLIPDEYNGRFFNNQNEPMEPAPVKGLDWDGVIEDGESGEIQDAEIVEDYSETDPDLPDFLQPDGGEGVEPEEEPKKRGKRGKNTSKNKNEGSGSDSGKNAENAKKD